MFARFTNIKFCLILLGDTLLIAGVPFRTLPGYEELISGKISVNQLKKVEYEDLLRRDPLQLNIDEICGYIAGKNVMVTGGAGSIGSELCRQVATHKPKQLVILERNESGLYNIALDLKRDYPDLDVVSALGATQNRHRVLFRYDEVFVTHRIIQKISGNGRSLFLQKGDIGSVAGRIEADSILGRGHGGSGHSGS